MLSILGLIAVFIAAYFVYTSARDTGRNAVGWSLLTVAVGIGLQIILPMVIIFIIAAVMMISGKPTRDGVRVKCCGNEFIAFLPLSSLA